MSDELKPCPFCGSIEYQHEGTTAGELWFSCQGCGAHTPISTHATEDDYTEAIKLANTRPLEDALLAELERLKRLLADERDMELPY